jgi:N-acetylneuraminic acid mutarotase
MLTARSALAAAAYENQVYAIGGETDEGVTGALERYDPRSDTWTALAPKPLAAAEIGAAVIGGKIYVPGGLTAEGMPTTVLEVYDPRSDAWSLGPSMPEALSAYALAAFEGKLYLFGGWNGTGYVASVYAFDPDSGLGSALPPACRAAAGRLWPGADMHEKNLRRRQCS